MASKIEDQMPKRSSKILKDPEKIVAAIESLFTTEDIPLFAPLGADIISKAMAEMERKKRKKDGKCSLKTVARKKRTRKAARPWRKMKD